MLLGFFGTTVNCFKFPTILFKFPIEIIFIYLYTSNELVYRYKIDFSIFIFYPVILNNNLDFLCKQ